MIIEYCRDCGALTHCDYSTLLCDDCYREGMREAGCYNCPNCGLWLQPSEHCDCEEADG